MAKNKDGFEAGQDLSFEDLMKLRAGAAPQVEDDPRAEIAKMKKDDLIESLKAHGADTDGKVDELRERLAAIVLVDL